MTLFWHHARALQLPPTRGPVRGQVIARVFGEVATCADRRCARRPAAFRRSGGAAEGCSPPFEMPYTLTLPDTEPARWLARRLDRCVQGPHIQTPGRNHDARQQCCRLSNTATRSISTWSGDSWFTRERVLTTVHVMPQITELHILPVLAVARLGSSPDPMANYDAVVDPADPLGVRRLVGAPTFVVHRPSGEIRERIDRPDVRFARRPRPHTACRALFRVWARVQDALQPLTPTLVRESGYSIDDLFWRVTTANLKIARRTGDRRDRIVAHVGPFSDHRIQALEGECRNFIEGRTVPFGHASMPPASDRRLSEIRLRFTPPKGLFTAPRRVPATSKPFAVHNRRRGKWKGFEDLGSPTGTSPSDTVLDARGRPKHYPERRALSTMSRTASSN